MKRHSCKALVVASLIWLDGACDDSIATETAASELTVQQHVDQILASDQIIFAHDHLRDVPHLQDAVSARVTATTVELTVDQMKWVDRPDDGVCAPLPAEVTTCCGGYQNNTCFAGLLERSWFDGARSDLANSILHLTGQAQIVGTVADLDAAKAAHHLGIVIGTEGSLVACSTAADCPASPGMVAAGTGALANIESLYQLGWRKAQLRHAGNNVFTTVNVGLTNLGKQVVAAFNRRGIVLDTDHLSTAEIASVLSIDNAPLLISHEWQRGMVNTGPTPSDDLLMRHVWSGGGHGVIALNALGSNYTTFSQAGCVGGTCNVVPPGCAYGVSDGEAPATTTELVQRLDCLRQLVGIDHVALGPDFMPGGDKYAIGGGVRNQVPQLAGTNPGSVVDLVTALVTYQCWVDVGGSFQWQTCYSDADIKKILGGNLRDLYHRVWDPTHGYDGGAAHFQLCANGATQPACLAAASNGGQGDLHHRAISCQHSSGHQPVGLQISYSGVAPNGQWQFRDLNNNLVSCHAPAGGSTLVVSWGDGASMNGRLGTYGTSSCDGACQAAITGGGVGTTSARALSCASSTAPGIVGLQLAYTSNAWRYYNVLAQLATCAASSTWIASWDAGTPNAYLRLCDDANGNPACQAAATNNGAGTGQAKALGCLNSTATDPACSGSQCGPKVGGQPSPIAAPSGLGSVALEVAYLTDALTGAGRWFYYDQAGALHRCVHGSVLVGTTISP